MYLTPKNVELKPGTIFFVLDKLEVLRETDLVRDKVYNADYYSADAEGKMNWQLVKDAMPGWIGRTISDYENWNGNYQKSNFEIIRIIS